MKITIPYILLILNCEKYKYKADKQKQTWLKNIQEYKNMVYFHIIGSKEKCAEYADKESDDNECDDKECVYKEYILDHKNHILYTSTNDDYLSLPDKIITAMKAINETYDYEYIFKTDDDQDLIQPSFFKTIIPILNQYKYHYGGLNIVVPDHYSSYYRVHNELPKQLFLKGTNYCNGRFYLLSKEAVENLLKKKEEISKHIIEDHAIGLYLDNEYKKKCLILNSNNYFKDYLNSNNYFKDC